MTNLKSARNETIFAIKRLMWVREDEAYRERIDALRRRVEQAEALTAALKAEIEANRARTDALLASL